MGFKKMIGFVLTLLFFFQITSAADDLRDTIENSKVSLDARYRLELVD